MMRYERPYVCMCVYIEVSHVYDKLYI